MEGRVVPAVIEFMNPEAPIITRLRSLAEMIGDSQKRNPAGDAVLCSAELFQRIKDLATEAAAALESQVEIPIYDLEEIHRGCTVQVLKNSTTGETSVGWWEESKWTEPS